VKSEVSPARSGAAVEHLHHQLKEQFCNLRQQMDYSAQCESEQETDIQKMIATCSKNIAPPDTRKHVDCL